MERTFGVDFSKAFGFGNTDSLKTMPNVALRRRRGPKVSRPGLPPTVRGLPWSKMLRSFREKSA